MELALPVMDPNLAYKSGWMWLPKKKANVAALQESLIIYIQKGKNLLEPLLLWQDSKHHIGVPRELVDVEKLKYRVVDLTPKFEHVEFRSKVTLDFINPDKTTQKDAFADLIKRKKGILNLSCGAGKTVVMLHAIAHWGVPTLIVNDKEHILEQWREAIEDFLEFDGEIGWIQGKPQTWKWKCPITLASLKTLSMYHDQLPLGLDQWFGLGVWDEIHHLSAPTFSQTAPLVRGMRLGATATVERGDGTEIVYYYHVGPVAHSNLEQDIAPTIWFVDSPTSVDLDTYHVRLEVCDITGEIHLGKLAKYVGTLNPELQFIKRHLDRAIKSNRNILALSVSKDLVYALSNMYPKAGIITGDVKSAESRRLAMKHQLTLATAQLATEALNDRDLDALFILTEFTKPGMLQQAVGRIQRMKQGKKKPLVIVIAHSQVVPLNAMNWKMRHYFKNQGFEIREVKQ